MQRDDRGWREGWGARGEGQPEKKRPQGGGRERERKRERERVSEKERSQARDLTRIAYKHTTTVPGMLSLE